MNVILAWRIREFVKAMVDSNDDVLNISTLVAALFMLVSYHLYLYYCFKYHRRSTVYGLTSSARRVFIASIMHRKEEILAVQTLRNWVMAASAFCSTSIIIIFGLVAFLSAIGTRQVTSDPSNPLLLGLLSGPWFIVKVVLLVLLFMTAFFCFLQAMRFFNHVGILVNINISEDELKQLDPAAEIAYNTLTPDFVGDLLNRGAFWYTTGTRCYMVSFPIVAWLGGGYFLLPATFLLIIVLRLIDFNNNLNSRSLKEPPASQIELTNVSAVKTD